MQINLSKYYYCVGYATQYKFMQEIKFYERSPVIGSILWLQLMVSQEKMEHMKVVI